MKRILLLSFGAILAFAVDLAHGSAGEGNPALDAYMQGEIRKAGIPGASYASVTHGRVTAAGAAGEERAGGHDPVTTATPFELGSISKSFTALAVMQLVEACKVDLASPVSIYLPEFAGKALGAITIRQLLSHTSGFAERQGNRTQTDLSTDGEALARRVQDLARAGPAGTPGETWEYSNANYQILGRLIERIEGRPFGQVIETRILLPMGMRDSFVQDGRRAARVATGHRPWFGNKIANRRELIGAGSAPQGGVVSSARDMARYIAIMLNGRDDIVGAASKRQMMRSAGAAAPDYGFGWSIDGRTGVVSHSGANPGYEALIAMIPAQQKGVVILTNAGSGFGWGETGEFRYGLASRALNTRIPVERSGLQKSVFVLVAMLPAFFALTILRDWRRSRRRRAIGETAKRSRVAALLPLALACALAGLLLLLFPAIAGADITSIVLFMPDLGLVLALASASAIIWGFARLAFDLPGSKW